MAKPDPGSRVQAECAIQLERFKIAKLVLSKRGKLFETIRWFRQTPEPLPDLRENRVLSAANSLSEA